MFIKKIFSKINYIYNQKRYSRDQAIKVADSIIKETLAVAAAEGVDISEAQGRECLDKVIASNQDNKSSMAMDLDAKRKSEMDFINGRIVHMADKHGVDVPVNRSMMFLVHALESHFEEPDEGKN